MDTNKKLFRICLFDHGKEIYCSLIDSYIVDQIQNMVRLDITREDKKITIITQGSIIIEDLSNELVPPK